MLCTVILSRINSSSSFYRLAMLTVALESIQKINLEARWHANMSVNSFELSPLNLMRYSRF